MDKINRSVSVFWENPSSGLSQDCTVTIWQSIPDIKRIKAIILMTTFILTLTMCKESSMCLLVHLSLKTGQGDNYCHSQFTDEKTKAKRSIKLFSASHRASM